MSAPRRSPHEPVPLARPRSSSVLIPSFQGAEFLERVLASLAEQRVDFAWDLTLVDSGSTDATLAIAERWRARFPVPFALRRIDPVEFDHGDTRNLLAAESSGELLVFLTQDAVPIGSGWLARLVANFDDPRVGAAYCRNVVRPGADALTRVFAEADPGYAPERREVRLPTNYGALDPHERRLLYNFNDVASAVRRSLWERHPFPRAWFGEDLLMARALLEGGYTVVYDRARDRRAQPRLRSRRVAQAGRDRRALQRRVPGAGVRGVPGRRRGPGRAPARGRPRGAGGGGPRGGRARARARTRPRAAEGGLRGAVGRWPLGASPSDQRAVRRRPALDPVRRPRLSARDLGRDRGLHARAGPGARPEGAPGHRPRADGDCRRVRRGVRRVHARAARLRGAAGLASGESPRLPAPQRDLLERGGRARLPPFPGRAPPRRGALSNT